MLSFKNLCALALLLSPLTVLSLDLTITKNKTATIPRTLGGGYMWEDISHSGDGGLYAEILQNRAFQAVEPGTVNSLAAWQAINTTIAVVNNTAGVSAALPNSLQVIVPSGATGTVGIRNTGYWGIKVQKGWKYTGSFYAKTSSSYNGPITVTLESTTGTTFASYTFTKPALTSTYKKYSFTFTSQVSAPNISNTFTLELNGAVATGATFYFGLFTLFPPTYKNRPNGMRIDIAEALAATKPGVWRFPGGNNLEGIKRDYATFDTRWKWNETIGPLENRPGRFANWGYPNTDGLGLLEYLDWCEDIGATPILGIWDGIVINDYANLPGWPVVPEAELQPYVDDAIHEIEFITADAATNQWGALRASLGRKEPYKLEYVEIGNEDQFAPDTYHAYRWKYFASQIAAKYPDLKILSSYWTEGLDPVAKYYDTHTYAGPSWFLDAFLFDNQVRNGTQYFVGEYAVTSTNDADPLGTFENGRLRYPTLQGAVAESASYTGWERNSDIVFAAAYAPLLAHTASTNWTPDLITFDAGSLVKSISYYAIQMFSLARGTHVLSTAPISNKAATPLYWVASVNENEHKVFLKIVNAGNTTATANVKLEYLASSQTASVISLQPNADGRVDVYNTLENPTVVVPKTSTLKGITTDRKAKTSAFTYTLVPNSVSIVTVTIEQV